MSSKETDFKLKQIKERLEASGISRREALAAALGACGTLLVTWGANRAQARGPVDCSDSCAQSCVTCSSGCSNGPNK
jgi:hypothetical protein